MKDSGDALWRVVWYGESPDPGMLVEALVRGRYSPPLRGRVLWILRGCMAPSIISCEFFFEEELWAPKRIQEL